jgi:hypothetical protein
MRSVFVFQHIPKTAGTTWRSILYKQYSDGAVCSIYDDDRYYYSFNDFNSLSVEKKNTFQAVIGHFGHNIKLDLNNDADLSFGVFLRNPVDRCLSLYNHFFNHQRQGELPTLTTFLDEKNIQFDNLQTRVLSGMNPAFGKVDENVLAEAVRHLLSYDFFGLTERFNESYALAVLQLDWNVVPFLSKNIGRNKHCDVRVDVTDNERARLFELNKFDKILYDVANDIFQRRVDGIKNILNRRWSRLLDQIISASREPIVFESEGRIGQITQRKIKGWARLIQCDHPARLRVFWNKKLVGVIDAVEERTIPSSVVKSRCGFTYEFENEVKLTPDDEIEVIVAATGKRLNKVNKVKLANTSRTGKMDRIV